MNKDTFDCFLGDVQVRVTAEYILLEPDPVYFAEVYLKDVRLCSFDILPFLSEEAQESLIADIMEELSDRHNKNL